MSDLPGRSDELVAVLAESRRRGLLGPAEPEEHVRHAAGFIGDLVDGARVVDLGSGGGVPGLVLACARPDLHLTLVDAASRRCEVLRWAVDALDAGSRVEVMHGRAEDLARSPLHRERHDAVVARLFGPPAVTAECARGFLRSGGVLVVSEPPSMTEAERWPVDGLGRLGFGPATARESMGAGFVAMAAVGVCPEGVPRRAGVPARRPRF